MKNTMLFALLAVGFISCKKETCTDGIKNQDEVNVDCGGACSPCSIEYPETGNYGANILFVSDTLHFTHEHYSLRAVVPQGSTFKVRLNSLIGGEWWYNTGAVAGWSITPINGGEQFFECLSSTCDLEVDLSNMTGLFKVSFYENSTSVTRTGYISVE